MSHVDKKLLELKQLVEAAEISLQQARHIIAKLTGDTSTIFADKAKKIGNISSSEEGQIIEGLFDGQNMVGPDGKKYSVPANYASKSKLVEGDTLKLTITPDGSFVYKQINLLDRDRLVGTLNLDDKTDEYRVVADGKSYQVLTASITYYKGEAGDQVTILVPKDKESVWAAVENVYKPGDEIPPAESEPAPKEEVKEKKDLPATEPIGGASIPAEPIAKEENTFLETSHKETKDISPEISESVPSIPDTTPDLSPLGAEKDYLGGKSDETEEIEDLKPSPPSPAQPEDIFSQPKNNLDLSHPPRADKDSFLQDDLDLDKKDDHGLEEL